MKVRGIALAAASFLLGALVVVAIPATGASDPSVVHFTAAGDFGSEPETNAVLDLINANDPDLNLAVGDLSYRATGAEQAWCDLVTAHVGAGFPFELVSGNHESDGLNGNINDFSACLPNQLPGVIGTYGRQYFVDVPQASPLVRFIMIDAAENFSDGLHAYDPGTARYNWTVAAIDSARAAGVAWVVVGVHKPCFSLGQYSCEIGAGFTNMLVSKNVDLVLNWARAPLPAHPPAGPAGRLHCVGTGELAGDHHRYLRRLAGGRISGTAALPVEYRHQCAGGRPDRQPRGTPDRLIRPG